MPGMATNNTTWRRSSHCTGGFCVWVLGTSGTSVKMRDEAGDVVEFSTPSWRSFVHALRREELVPSGRPVRG